MGIRYSGAVLALIVATAPRVPAQTTADPDPRWNAWLGCWQLVEERVRDEWDAEPAEPELVPARGAVVCVTPGEQSNAVRLTTRVESQSTLADTIVADGASRPVREPGCEGTQRTEWSSNGRRLLATAELTCGTARRRVSGLAMIDAARLWTDVQVVEESGRETIRVRRYRRSPDAGQSVGRAAALTIEEVKEIAQKLPSSALEAVLVETGATFPLNSKRLVELDEAQVPERIIDLMVALSFPNKFVIERRASSGSGSSGLAYGDPYDWPYYYAPFGYSSFGQYDMYYYGAPYYVVVDPAPIGPQPSGQGRVVDGFGYTRVRSREPVGVNASGGGAGGSGAGSTGSSTGGGTVSSGGYSGGGGGDGGRTAVSRPPG